MAPKRKSDVVIDEKENNTLDGFVSGPAAKKARVLDAPEASSSTAKGKGKEDKNLSINWQDIELEGEDEGGVPVYDDCNEIRRKIRLLQKEPGFKVTHWLRDIGGVNSNSLSRFMKVTGPTAGAENGTYYAAYKYFEKVRIATGKKKTGKRLQNEENHSGGMPLRDRKYVWVMRRT